MKVETTVPDPGTPSLPNSTDTAKLASLLALAAGAIAMPQTSEADIIYTNLNPTVSVGTSSTIPFVLDGLPGIARLGFFARTRATLVSSSRHVTASQGAGYVRLRT